MSCTTEGSLDESMSNTGAATETLKTCPALDHRPTSLGLEHQLPRLPDNGTGLAGFCQCSFSCKDNTITFTGVLHDILETVPEMASGTEEVILHKWIYIEKAVIEGLWRKQSQVASDDDSVTLLLKL